MCPIFRQSLNLMLHSVLELHALFDDRQADRDTDRQTGSRVDGSGSIKSARTHKLSCYVV